MKKYLFTAALLLTPAIAIAEHPEGSVVADIKSEIREDDVQLQQDKEAGNTEAVREDEKQIAEDKLRLRAAIKHPNRVPDAPPPQEKVKAKEANQVEAAPPAPDHDELNDKTARAAKLNPDRTFNHSADVDNEIR